MRSKMKRNFLTYYISQIKEMFITSEYNTSITRGLTIAIIKALFVIVLINPVAMYIMYMYDEGGMKPDKEWFERFTKKQELDR